ncbi:MAG: hypothetical protein JST85_02905 [Acidobacteria bacterium]|nr:hypothetical protein [Acidobacteriota bacterium]
MSQDTQDEPISKKRVVYQIPGMDDVTIRLDVEYRKTDAGIQTMDLYSPSEAKSGEQIPAVIFVSGYPDAGMQKMLGCKLKEMGSYVSWAQLVAATGLVAITYSTVEPVSDIEALLRYVRQNAADLGIDEHRIGVWACSGNVPNALSLLMQEAQEYVKCAVLLYGLMLDLDGSTNVAQAAKIFGFANPAMGKSVDDLPADLPLFIARAGQDHPQLNETIGCFLAKSVSRNLPITFVNHHTGPHFFDVMDDSETTRQIIRQVLEFMRFHLLV